MSSSIQERVNVGLVHSPAFAQARIEKVLRGIDDTEVYIDDIGVFSNSRDNNISKLDMILLT